MRVQVTDDGKIAIEFNNSNEAIECLSYAIGIIEAKQNAIECQGGRALISCTKPDYSNKVVKQTAADLKKTSA